MLDTRHLRLFAGPGHVIYSAFAGYLPRLGEVQSRESRPDNRERVAHRGIHQRDIYSTLVGLVPDLIATFYPGVAPSIGYIAFVSVYDGFFGYLLYRKISRYRAMYAQVEKKKERDEKTTTTTGPNTVEFDSQREMPSESEEGDDTQRKPNTRTSTNGGTENGLLGNEGSGLLATIPSMRTVGRDGETSAESRRRDRRRNQNSNEFRIVYRLSESSSAYFANTSTSRCTGSPGSFSERFVTRRVVGMMATVNVSSPFSATVRLIPLSATDPLSTMYWR